MTIKELIAILNQYPEDMAVVVSGYEEGYNDVSTVTKRTIVRDINTQWYRGQHDDAEKDQVGVQVLWLYGENKLAEWV